MCNYEFIKSLDISQMQKFMAMCANDEIGYEIMNCGNCRTEEHSYDCSLCMMHWLVSDCERLKGELDG